MSSSRITPGDFLKQAVGQEVRVRLNNGTDYRGNLTCLDGFLNIAMEKTKEYANGELQKSYGDAFVRGNNVVYITNPSQGKSQK
jgi:U6 snRNA-associated Sm-like protein LSm6